MNENQYHARMGIITFLNTDIIFSQFPSRLMRTVLISAVEDGKERSINLATPRLTDSVFLTYAVSNEVASPYPGGAAGTRRLKNRFSHTCKKARLAASGRLRRLRPFIPHIIYTCTCTPFSSLLTFHNISQQQRDFLVI